MTAVTPLLMHWSYCSLALNHWNISQQSLGWGYCTSFLCFLLYRVALYYQTIGYIVNITFIFNRHHCSSSLTKPVKYEHGLEMLPNDFVISESSIPKKLINSFSNLNLDEIGSSTHFSSKIIMYLGSCKLLKRNEQQWCHIVYKVTMS